MLYFRQNNEEDNSLDAPILLEKEEKAKLIEWLMEKISVRARGLDASSVTCVVSKEILTLLACDLIQVLTEDENTALISCLSPQHTLVLQSYCFIMKYLVKRYEEKCTDSLLQIRTLISRCLTPHF